MNNVKGLRYKRTLFVGLGGAGAKTLTELKKRILAANNQKIPKQIKFLLIDTNATELSNYNNFDASEKICIAVREPYERFRADKDKHTHEFIPDVNTHSLLALERGAGQVRSNGHFAVIENQYSNKLMRIFHERADELMNIDINRAGLEKDPKIEIRVVFSLAGGTGSGTFLPISLLLRSAIKHSELIGYAISPFHYERTVENSAKKTVMANGYAALSELDYMMHFGRPNINQENIKFNFGPDINTQQIEQSNRPFDEVYYIDKRTNLPLSDSIEYTYNERERMFRNTADIIHLASTNIISGHTGTVDNVRQKIHEGQFDVEDKFGWISGVGMAEIFLDPKDSKSEEIRQAALKCILDRTCPNTLSDSSIKSIGLHFINEEWNETGDPIYDKDLVQKIFIGKAGLEAICQEYVNKKNHSGLSLADIQWNFDDAVSETKHETTAAISNAKKNLFANQLSVLIKNFIDGRINDSGELQEADHNSVRSLISMEAILENIIERLDASIIKLGKEAEEHASDAKASDLLRSKAASGQTSSNSTKTTTTKKKGFFARLFSNNAEETEIVEDTTSVTESDLSEAKAHQADALYNRMLKERAEAAKKLLEECKDLTNSAKKTIKSWDVMLEEARTAGINISQNSADNDNAVEPQNRVQVHMSNVHNGYYLTYSNITELAGLKSSDMSVSSEDIFGKICESLSKGTGTLQDYLIKSIQEIDSQKGAEKTRGRQEKTECQKAIDQLIDLSAPTMQIDAHGYGARIKADQFYYIMTSDEDIEFSEEDKKNAMKSTSTLGGIKHKTVAGLLQYLLEQNSQDIHVNRVNVSGWENKAVLYRVKGAIPPYFIEGVAEGPLGGQTMEGCYEELKKTRAAYTPFSHATLRQKLENGISVLRPHDSTSEEEAMEHWVNFMMLTALGQHGYIKFIPEDSETYANCSRQLGAKGSYSISSERLGSIQTGELADRTPILVLGNNRADAFHMFARYCKDILEEHKDYLDRMKHFEYCGIARQMVEMTGEKYMDIILSGWDHLFFDEEDQELLRREMDYIETRRKKFEDTLKGRSLRRTIVETHEKDSEESSSDNVQGKEEEKPE